MNTALRLLGAATPIGITAACSAAANPLPRRAATQGVAPTTERSPNAPYYQGAAPDLPRGTRSGGLGP